jgi:hypothetical protein
MSYQQNYDLAVDSVFMKQVLIAMLNQAATVLSEATTTAGHTARAQLAAAVAKNPTNLQAAFAYAVQTQAGITPLTVPSTVADSAVQTAVAAVWNAIAGYFNV